MLHVFNTFLKQVSTPNPCADGRVALVAQNAIDDVARGVPWIVKCGTTDKGIFLNHTNKIKEPSEPQLVYNVLEILQCIYLNEVLVGRGVVVKCCKCRAYVLHSCGKWIPIRLFVSCIAKAVSIAGAMKNLKSHVEDPWPKTKRSTKRP